MWHVFLGDKCGYTIELACSVTKETEHFVSLYMSAVITGEYTFTVYSEELIGTTE